MTGNGQIGDQGKSLGGPAGASPAHETAQVAQGKTEVLSDIRVIQTRKRIQFGASHALLVILFLWLLVLQAIGVYLFASGFLLTRLVLNDRSQCADPPVLIDSHHAPGRQHGCWHPRSFDKAIIIIIDALRYDFTVPLQETVPHAKARHYHNALSVLYETAAEEPEHSILLPFIADPPTTTLQRLKGLTTGTLPTFVDAGSNFAGTAIDEDNLIDQLVAANKTIVQLGDDTWHALYPSHFEPNLTRPFDSFNVWDLFTVDNGVTEHLFPLLQPSMRSRWDVIIGHYLGVDHAGHRYGPDHPAMNAKLTEMDGVLRRLIDVLQDDTLLVVFGDHGMDSKGDHGGESSDEVEASLWMYSKRPHFGRLEGQSKLPPQTATDQRVAQIDIVPTLALLLGLPIPFNNLGSPIGQAFIGTRGSEHENLARANRLASAQVSRYIQHYRQVRNFEAGTFTGSESAWAEASKMWGLISAKSHIRGTGSSPTWKAIASQYELYQTSTIETFRSLWARFDLVGMLQGVIVLGSTLVVVGVYACSVRGDHTDLTPILLFRSLLGALVGALTGFVADKSQILGQHKSLLLFLAAVGGNGGLLSSFWMAHARIAVPLPKSVLGWTAAIFTVALSASFASNSYTIWEDQILLVLLMSIGFLFLVTSTRRGVPAERASGSYHAALFIVLTRLSSQSRLCREEQMPSCQSTFYANAASATSSAWTIAIPVALSMLIPSITQAYFETTKSYNSTARTWNGLAVRLVLVMNAMFWSLDVADDSGWFDIESSTLKTIKTTVAQLVLAISLIAGYSILITAGPFLSIQSDREGRTDRGSVVVSDENTYVIEEGGVVLSISGHRNAHGTRYFPLLTTWVMAVAVLSKPIAQGVIGLLLWQILCLLEILAANPDLRSSAAGPFCLALLGCFHFFKTGHNATLASIQWDAAFIPLKTVRYPWAPIFIILNTFGSQILCVLAVPLTQLWKVPTRKPGLLGNVARAMAQHILFYAVITFATTLWAGHLRRHLMLYRVFMPRYLLASIVGTIVHFIGAVVAIGATRWSMLSVASVYGWP